MPTYQLQIKQIVDYPRCRIYRQFVRFLMEDRSIRVSGGSGLFYFTVLCSYRIGAEGQTQAIEAFSVLVDVLVDHTPCTPLHLHIQSNRKLVHSILPKK